MCENVRAVRRAIFLFSFNGICFAFLEWVISPYMKIMPPLLPVQSLYKTCLLVIFNHLRCLVRQNTDSLEALRELLQSLFHRGIRQNLIDIATKRCSSSDAFTLLDLLKVLLDKSIKHLDLSRGDDSATLQADQCARLFDYLEQYNGIGLQELVVKVRLTNSYRGGVESISPGNFALHHVLRHGLASSLHTLVLHSVCDNETLHLLGQHAVHLSHLDVSSSWLVDDRGLHQLLLKNPDVCYFDSEAFDTVEAIFTSMWAISHAFGGPHVGVNNCCSSLQEVRIQDTNTSEIGVALLLLFVPNLRSLGGFIYYRSVGEAIISLLRQSQNTLRLSLSELWDTHMPSLKASVLSRALPNLSSLYTRATWLPTLNTFPKLYSLTIDFDFMDYSQSLERFLRVIPQMLKKLVLVDQVHAVDLAMIGELCPGLEEVSAKLVGSWGSGSRQKAYSLLPSLHTCRVRILNQETFRSLLVHTQKLHVFEVVMEKMPHDEPNLDDEIISSALSERVSPLQLTRLIITSNSGCNLSFLSVHLLAQACPKLKLLGDLNLWKIQKRQLVELTNEIMAKNWDLQLVCRGELYPSAVWRNLMDI